LIYRTKPIVGKAREEVLLDCESKFKKEWKHYNLDIIAGGDDDDDDDDDVRQTEVCPTKNK
jgi:glycerol-3-phosphate cytidylyltransferase-like family protein